MYLAGLPCLIAWALFAAVIPAQAGEPKWPEGRYQYVVLDQDLRNALSQFGMNTGIRIAMSEAVQGRLHGQVADGTARTFLDDLTREFGLDWYFDGTVMSVTAASETQTKFIPLKGVAFEKLHQELAAAGLLDRRFPVIQAPAGNVAIASGPPRFLSLVEQAVATLSPEVAPAPTVEKTLVVFRGSAAATAHFK